jgi:hypothetical protein
MGNTFATLKAAGLGAILMYYLDPDRGNRRRAYLRDQIHSMTNTKRQCLNVMVRDFKNRSYGTFHDVKSRFEPDDAPSSVVVERVRAQLGRWVSHPSSIEVSAHDGHVVLSGLILANEVQDLIHHVRSVRGVKSIDNQLEAHSASENIPGLQGKGHIPHSDRWTPATCLAMGSIGVLMALAGTARRNPLGGLITAAGVGMVVKSFRDTEGRFEPNNSHVATEGRGDGEASGERRVDYEEASTVM